MTVAVVIGAILLACMLGVAGYAVKALPAGALVPLNVGVPEHSVWLSRLAGLAAWIGVGVVAYAILAGLTVSPVADNWMPAVRMVLLPSAMLVILAAQGGAVIHARHRQEDEAAALLIQDPVSEAATADIPEDAAPAPDAEAETVTDA